MMNDDDTISNASSRRSRASGVGANDGTSSKHLNFFQSRTVNLLTDYFPIFPVLLTISTTPRTLIALVVFAVTAVQHWAFVLNPYFAATWGEILGTDVSSVLYGFHMAFYDPILISGASVVNLFLSLCVTVVQIITLIVCMFFYVSLKDERKKEGNVATVILRLLLELNSTILFIPLFQTAFAGAVCGNTGYVWMMPYHADTQCWGSVHLAMFVISMIVLVIMLPLLYIRVVCVFDHNPLSHNIVARRTSVMSKITFLHDVLACLLFSVMISWDVRLGYAAVHAASSALLVAGYIYFLPYYKMSVNRFFVFTHMVECVASLFVYCGHRRDTFPVSSVFLLGVGSVAVVLVTLMTAYRVNDAFYTAMRRAELWSVAIHERADYAEKDGTPAEYGGDDVTACATAEEVAQLPFPRGLSTTEEFAQYPGLNYKVMECIVQQKMNSIVFTDGDADEKRLLPVAEPYITRVYRSSDVELSLGYLALYSQRFTLGQIADIMIVFAANILSRGLVTFPEDPCVMQAFVQFICTYLPGLGFMGVDLLKRSLRLSPNIEGQFRGLKLANELRVALGIRTHAHSVRSNVARTTHGKVLKLMNTFWVELTEPSVNIMEVSRIADLICINRDKAVQQFDEALLQQTSADPVLVRRLGDFFQEVMIAPDAAQECFTESRDLYEAKQARSMRGTKQRGSDVDVYALTDRMRRLLSFHRSGGTSGGKISSSLMMQLGIVSTILLLLLAGLCSALVYIATALDDDAKYFIESTMTSLSIRSSASRFASSAIGYKYATTKDAQDSILTDMSLARDTFRRCLRFLTSGAGKPKTEEERSYMYNRIVPFDADMLEEGYTLFSLSKSFQQAMDRYVNETTGLSVARDSFHATQFLLDSAMVLVEGYDRFFEAFIRKGVSSVLTKWLIVLVVVLALSLMLLLLVMCAFQFAFHRTAASRFFTFQLFTLIPYEALEKLATETKDRLHRINMEKSFRQSSRLADNTHDAATEEAWRLNKVSQDDNTKPNATLAIGTHMPVSGSSAPVKSCLRKGDKAAAPASRSVKKVVRFNPTVDVVGDKSDGTAKDRAGSGNVNNLNDADMNMLLFEQMHLKKRLELTAARPQPQAQRAVSVAIVYLVLTLACTVVAISLLSLVLVKGDEMSAFVVRRLDGQRRLSDLSLQVPLVLYNTLSFVHTGNALHFQNTQDTNSRTIQDFSLFIQTDNTPEMVHRFIRMQQLSSSIANMSLDSSLLAAIARNVSLSYWSDVRAFNSYTDEELVAMLMMKYPHSAEVAKKIESGLDMDLNLVFSFCILLFNGAGLMTEFRSHFFTLMEDLSPYDELDGYLHTSYLVGVLVVAVVGAVASLAAAVTPLHRFLSRYLTRTHATITFLLFAGLVVACSLTMTVGARKVQSLTRYKSSLEAVVSFVNGYMQVVATSSAFAYTLEPKYWFTAMSDEATIASKVFSRHLIQVSANSQILTAWSSMLRRLDRLRFLNNVSFSLIINSQRDKMMVEEPMSDGLDAAFWNIEDEPTYIDDIIKYNNTFYYTNKEDDLAKPAKSQYRLASSILTGPEYTYQCKQLVTDSISLFNEIIDRQTREAAKAIAQRRILVIVTLVVSGLLLIACVWLFPLLIMASYRSLLTSSDTKSSASNDVRHRKVLFRIRMLVVVLGLFIVTTFAVLLWYMQSCRTYVEELDEVGELAYLSTKNLYLFRRLAVELVSFPSLSAIGSSTKELLLLLADQFQGTSSSGVPHGVSRSFAYNNLMFGNISYNADTNILLSYFQDNCSRFINPSGKPSPLPPTGDYGGLTVPVLDALGAWIVMIYRGMMISEEVTNQDGAALREMQPLVTSTSNELFAALDVSNAEVKVGIIGHSNMVFGICLALAIVSLVLTCLIYFLLVIPTIIQLIREEEAVRMLLQMIPSHVRDEVPAISQYIETGRISNAAELQRKFEASEKLLQNILPQKIAARLKSGEQPIADTHACVSILFTDFVGFTKRSSTMQAREIVDFLNEVFLEFDTIVELLELEKIKTIGDAFFMAGGLDPRVTDHALRVVEAGLMLFDALEEHNERHPSRTPLQMRLGVHSGPAVAGVIGIKKVAYDMWGESVEIANAMESTGVPGYVHISEDTAQFVRGYFRLEPRGELPREKEHIPDNMPSTYLVVGRELPTPYMHLRRPKMLATKFIERSQQ